MRTKNDFLCFVSGAIAFLLVSHTARADIGTVQIQGEEPSAIETEAPLMPDSGTSSLSTELAGASQITAVEEGVNRPWLLHTSAGPTAFVLDAKQFEVAIPVNGSTQLTRHFFGYSLLLLDGYFGLTDSLTLNVIANSSRVMAGPKWNFWNGELWSLSVSPTIGYQFRQTDSYFNEKSSPIGIGFMASRVADSHHRIHFGFELSKDSEKSSYDYSYQGYHSTSTYAADLTEARVVATYEYRINRRHGMTTWLAPAFSGWVGNSTYTSTSSSNSTYTSRGSNYFVGLGVGYQYFLQRFGLQAGAEVGPKWYRHYSASYDYNDLTVSGSISGGLSFRL